MAIIEGTPGDDRDELGGNNLIGTDQADSIFGYAGADYLSGRGGNDYLDGGSGTNTILGGTGHDYVRSSGILGWYDGGSGNDIIDFGQIATRGAFDLAAGTARFNSAIASGPGAFTLQNFESIYTGSGDDMVWGTTGINEIRSGAGGDAVYGRGGADVLRGAAGNDYLDGGAGNDFLEGGDHDDVLYGAAGDDQLYGDNGNDELYGGDGNDALIGGLGNDTIDGLSGYDTMVLSGLTSAATVTAAGTVASLNGNTVEHDTFFRIEKIVGTYFADSMIASNGMALDGSTGNDTLYSGTGGNALDGSSGSDTVSYLLSQSGVNVNLATGAATGGAATGDTLARVENLTGSSYADTLRAAQGGSTLDGGAGDDALYGAAGADRIYGSAGGDDITGGGGADRFVYRSISESPWAGDSDMIFDFQKGSDKIDLSAIDADVSTPGNQAFSHIIFSAAPYQNSGFAAATIAWYSNGTGSYVAINVDNTDMGTGGNPYDEIEMLIAFDDPISFTLDDFIL